MGHSRSQLQNADELPNAERSGPNSVTAICAVRAWKGSDLFGNQSGGEIGKRGIQGGDTFREADSALEEAFYHFVGFGFKYSHAA